MATTKCFLLSSCSTCKLSLGICLAIHIQKLSVRVEIAERQVEVILPGLTSEEMGKEKNTRNTSPGIMGTRKGQSRAVGNPGDFESENACCCQNHLRETYAPMKDMQFHHCPVHAS